MALSGASELARLGKKKIKKFWISDHVHILSNEKADELSPGEELIHHWMEPEPFNGTKWLSS